MWSTRLITGRLRVRIPPGPPANLSLAGNETGLDNRRIEVYVDVVMSRDATPTTSPKVPLLLRAALRVSATTSHRAGIAAGALNPEPKRKVRTPQTPPASARRPAQSLLVSALCFRAAAVRLALEGECISPTAAARAFPLLFPSLRRRSFCLRAGDRRHLYRQLAAAQPTSN